jgi:DNA-directed RNA polymerase specialized sigma24 family protein
VVGDEPLAELLDSRCGDALRCAEFPRAQRFASRPPLARIFAGVTSKANRDARVVVAVRDHGYTMREVAEFLGRHYATVSRALAHADGRPPGAEMS